MIEGKYLVLLWVGIVIVIFYCYSLTQKKPNQVKGSQFKEDFSSRQSTINPTDSDNIIHLFQFNQPVGQTSVATTLGKGQLTIGSGMSFKDGKQIAIKDYYNSNGTNLGTTPKCLDFNSLAKPLYQTVKSEGLNQWTIAIKLHFNKKDCCFLQMRDHTTNKYLNVKANAKGEIGYDSNQTMSSVKKLKSWGYYNEISTLSPTTYVFVYDKGLMKVYRSTTLIHEFNVTLPQPTRVELNPHILNDTGTRIQTFTGQVYTLGYFKEAFPLRYGVYDVVYGYFEPSLNKGIPFNGYGLIAYEKENFLGRYVLYKMDSNQQSTIFQHRCLIIKPKYSVKLHISNGSSHIINTSDNNWATFELNGNLTNQIKGVTIGYSSNFKATEEYTSGTGKLTNYYNTIGFVGGYSCPSSTCKRKSETCPKGHRVKKIEMYSSKTGLKGFTSHCTDGKTKFTIGCLKNDCNEGNRKIIENNQGGINDFTELADPIKSKYQKISKCPKNFALNKFYGYSHQDATQPAFLYYCDYVPESERKVIPVVTKAPIATKAPVNVVAAAPKPVSQAPKLVPQVPKTVSQAPQVPKTVSQAPKPVSQAPKSVVGAPIAQVSSQPPKRKGEIPFATLTPSPTYNPKAGKILIMNPNEDKEDIPIMEKSYCDPYNPRMCIYDLNATY